MSTIKGTCSKGARSAHRNGPAEGRPVRAVPCAQQHRYTSRGHGRLAAGPARWATQRLPQHTARAQAAPLTVTAKRSPQVQKISGLAQTTRAVAAGVSHRRVLGFPSVAWHPFRHDSYTVSGSYPSEACTGAHSHPQPLPPRGRPLT